MFPYCFFMIKNLIQTKKDSCKFSQKWIVKKIQIGSKAPKIISLKINCLVTLKRRLKSKKVQEWNPPKMTKIIFKNHKNHKKLIVLKIICPVIQKQRLKSKKVQEWDPPKMTQIIIKTHKNKNKIIVLKIFYGLAKISKLKNAE